MSIAAVDFEVDAIVVPNPEFNPDICHASIVNQSIGFTYDNSEITTLSAENPNNWNKIQGLLYVPEFPADSPCINETRQFVPENVTRISDFRGSSCPIVSLAPWTSVNCTQEYFAQIRRDNVQGAIFFLPGGSTVAPPTVDTGSWNLNDNDQWLTENMFPIYALPGSVAAYMMQNLVAYSGNLTNEPHGAQLVQQYDARDFVRLWAGIPLNNGTGGIPSLWVFLIIVLAVLLFVVLVTSFVMHLVQGRHRRILQRRVANGEVDLEALGIKRLNVPQDILDKMPQYVYTSKEAPTISATAATKNVTPKKTVQFSQPTCPICLDDFVAGETTIRELPCNHIFHPECIDPFLKENSSLCPMCKKSALPPGFCPVQVTNLMVRRERLIRRMRQRVQVIHGEEVGGPQGAYGRRRRLYNNITRRFAVQPMNESVMIQRPLRRSPVPFPQQIADRIRDGHTEPGTELESVPTVLEPDVEPPPEVARQGTAARRAWRRERIANQQVSAYDRQARAADEEVQSQCEYYRPLLICEEVLTLYRETAMGKAFPFMKISSSWK